MAAAVRRQELPVKAAIEGPAACFRLLEIDGDLGMKHDQFVGLLMSATDNRMTLEDIQEAWVRHAGVEGASREHAADVGQDLPPIIFRMLLPPFLQAFADLAKTKYCRGDCDGGARGSTNRLLLRDVFDSITNPTAINTRYGVCAHLLRSDVCNFFLSQRPFTTGLFSIYGEGSASPQTSGCAKAAEGFTWATLSAQDGKEQTTITIPEAALMFWPGVLAVASDLQLIPRLIGLDALKAALEQVSTAPHRVNGALFGGSSLGQSGTSKRAATTGISYPQFVEVLSLLSASAAGRLRSLYPDMAGPEPSTAVRGSRSSDLIGCKAARTTDLDRAFAHTRESAGAGRDVDRVRKDEASNNARKHTIRKAMHVRAALRLKNARFASSAPGNSVASAVDEQIQEALPSYDLGVLKAFFHHARAAFQESRSGPAGDRGCSRAGGSPPAVGPTGRDKRGERRPPSKALGNCVFEQSSLSSSSAEMYVGMDGDEYSRYKGEEGKTPISMCSGTSAGSVVYPKSLLQGLFSSLGTVPIVQKISRRVSDLELEVLPRETDECETPMAGDIRGADTSLCREKQMEAERKPVPESVAPGVGGAFARLVVIKELQPVPEHVPDDARHLFELTLDHHQAGRYSLALETLEKGIAVWEELSGKEQANKYPTTLAGGLDASDEALAFSMKASIYQCAGNDDDALSMLFRADQAVASINEDDVFLRQACLASVLSEIGVTLYYSSRTDLSLRCFRMALFLRHKLLQCSKRSGGATEREEPASDTDGALKRGADYRMIGTDAVATEAGETAAALTLNNFAVCLAATGETDRAVQALITSSMITTSALGIEHPRSGVVSRNLALVKATKGGAGRRTPASISVGGRRVLRWEKDVWQSLNTRQLASHRCAVESEDLLLYDGVTQSTSHIIPGGFVFAGRLPTPADDKRVTSKGRHSKKGAKKRGKSSRRR